MCRQLPLTVLSPPLPRSKILYLFPFPISPISSAAVLTSLLGRRRADRIGEDHIIPRCLAWGGSLLILIFFGGNRVLVLWDVSRAVDRGSCSFALTPWPYLTSLSISVERLPIALQAESMPGFCRVYCTGPHRGMRRLSGILLCSRPCPLNRVQRLQVSRNE